LSGAHEETGRGGIKGSAGSVFQVSHRIHHQISRTAGFGQRVSDKREDRGGVDHCKCRGDQESEARYPTCQNTGDSRALERGCKDPLVSTGAYAKKHRKAAAGSSPGKERGASLPSSSREKESRRSHRERTSRAYDLRRERFKRAYPSQDPKAADGDLSLRSTVPCRAGTF